MEQTEAEKGNQILYTQYQIDNAVEKLLLANSNIPKYWAVKKLSDFVYPSKIAEDKMKEIFSWDFYSYPSVTLMSKHNGIGKTFIAVLLYKKFIGENLKILLEKNPYLQNYECNFFYNEADIYAEIFSAINNKEDTEEVINKFIRMPFLVIDDLFSSKENEFARSTMLRIINKRIDWERRPTVITTNLNVNEIQEIDSRIVSRLFDGLIYDFKDFNNDFRKLKK